MKYPIFFLTASLTLTPKIQPIELHIQCDVPIKSLAFLPVDGRPPPVSVSMSASPPLVVNGMMSVRARHELCCTHALNTNTFTLFVSRSPFSMMSVSSFINLRCLVISPHNIGDDLVENIGIKQKDL